MVDLSKSHPLAVPYKAMRARARNLIERRDYSDTWVLRFAEHKIAYVPIPKAANSSIRSALLPLIDVDAATVQHIQKFDGFERVRYSVAATSLTEDWYAFTVVRNPYSRFVSAFLDKVQDRATVLPAFAAMGVRSSDSIETFARIVERWPRKLLNDHIMPQAMLLSSAMANPGLNIYRMEDLRETWPEIGATISGRSGKRIGELGRKNASKEGQPWRTYLSPSVRDFVNRVYAADFSALGYSMESEESVAGRS